MRITRNTQEKLKGVLEALEWTVRYEKGNFKGGYCVVHDQQTIIINKFHPLESKVNTMVEILKDMEIDTELLSPEQIRFVERVKKLE